MTYLSRTFVMPEWRHAWARLARRRRYLVYLRTHGVHGVWLAVSIGVRVTPIDPWSQLWTWML